MKVIKLATQIKLEENDYLKLKYIAGNEKRTINAQMELFISQGIKAYESAHPFPKKKE